MDIKAEMEERVESVEVLKLARVVAVGHQVVDRVETIPSTGCTVKMYELAIVVVVVCVVSYAVISSNLGCGDPE